MYNRSTVSKVTVHIGNGVSQSSLNISKWALKRFINQCLWGKSVRKNRRSLDTVILPEGTKEDLMSDAIEFLESARWYAWAGVPHRRGTKVLEIGRAHV